MCTEQTTARNAAAEANLSTRVFPASDEALAEAMAFAEETMDAAEVPMKVSMQVSVALEELFVNVAHYAYPGRTGDVALGIGITDGLLMMRLTDSGVPFDPLAKADPDITLSAEERGIGGLGIFMVKKTMTNVYYEYRDGQNVLTITKEYATVN